MRPAAGRRADWWAQKGPSPTLGRWSSAPLWDGGRDALVGRERAYVTLDLMDVDLMEAPPLGECRARFKKEVTDAK